MNKSEYKNIYAGTRCLVTGHTGFKGAWLSQLLHHLEAQVQGFSLPPKQPKDLFLSANVAGQMAHQEGDLRDLPSIRKVVDTFKPEIVFHLAAQALVRQSYEDPKETFDTNIGGTVNLLESLRFSETVKVIIVITTDKVYENREWMYSYRETDRLGGKDPYSASKSAAEIVVSSFYQSFFKNKDIQVSTARAGNVIGGGDWAKDRIIPDAARALLDNVPLEVRNPDSTRPWQHVLEPLSGYLKLGQKMLQSTEHKYCGAWNFGPDLESCVTVRRMADLFVEAFGDGSWVDVSNNQTTAPAESKLLNLTSEKAFELLGWQPRWDLATTIERTSQWYKKSNTTKPEVLCLDDMQYFGLI